MPAYVKILPENTKGLAYRKYSTYLCAAIRFYTAVRFGFLQLLFAFIPAGAAFQPCPAIGIYNFRE